MIQNKKISDLVTKTRKGAQNTAFKEVKMEKIEEEKATLLTNLTLVIIASDKDESIPADEDCAVKIKSGIETIYEANYIEVAKFKFATGFPVLVTQNGESITFKKQVDFDDFIACFDSLQAKLLNDPF